MSVYLSSSDSAIICPLTQKTHNNYCFCTSVGIAVEAVILQTGKPLKSILKNSVVNKR